MTKRVNDVIAWSRDHRKMMFIGSLVTAPKLSEFVYDVESFHAPMRPIGDPLRARPDPSGPATNTRGSTPLKGKNKIPVAVQSKPKIVDKGKAKVVDTGKPKKVTYPIQTGGAFKIHERKVPTPLASPIVPPVKKSPVVEKKVEKPSKEARVLKLLDEKEGSEAGEPVKAPLKPVLEVHASAEESVEVIEVPPLKKRKLTKVAESEVPIIEPAAPVVEAVNVAGFLATRRKKVAPPSVPCLEEVKAFIANEPVLAVPVNAARPVKEEPLQAPEGSIPSILDHPQGLNIWHILEDIDMESKESVGMAGDNMGPSTTVAAKTPQKVLSPIPEARTSSRALTPQRPRSPTPIEVEKATGSKRPRASEASKASDSESSGEIQPEGANWTVGGKLAQIGEDLKGNPFKAVVDLIDHEKLQMKWDISARGIAEEMLTMQCLVSILTFRLLSFQMRYRLTPFF
jgi:hypothetical protein